MTFNLPGVLVTSVSPLFIPASLMVLTTFVANVQVSGSTSTVISILRDAVSVGTITIAASTLVSPLVNVGVSLKAGVDSLQYQITSAGTGASQLVIAAS